MKVQLTIIIFLIFSFLTVSSSYSQINNIEQVEPSKFNGKISTFDIYVELNNINDQIIGWYNYPGKSTKLRLEGSINSNGEIELKEFNYKAIQTGYFEGIIDENNTITGKWSKPDKKNPLPFSVELSNGVSLIQLNSETSVPTDNVASEENVDEEKRKMYQDSKVKGFSKIALWTTIGLILAIIGIIYFLWTTKKKLKEKPKEIHTKEVIREVQFMNDSMTPDDLRQRQGELFQKYVVEMFLTKKEYFDWIDTTRDIKYGDLYPKSNMNPDLLLRFKFEKHNWQEDFAVECKFRAGAKNDFVFIDNERKLKNYKDFARHNNIRTFLALGLGGVSNQPKNIFIIPIDKVHSEMKLDDLTPYLNKKPYFYYDFNKKTLN